ncbi:MAG: hypothetical protein ACMUJM_06875 [bacterium]
MIFNKWLSILCIFSFTFVIFFMCFHCHAQSVTGWAAAPVISSTAAYPFIGSSIVPAANSGFLVQPTSSPSLNFSTTSTFQNTFTPAASSALPFAFGARSTSSFTPSSFSASFAPTSSASFIPASSAQFSGSFQPTTSSTFAPQLSFSQQSLNTTRTAFTTGFPANTSQAFAPRVSTLSPSAASSAANSSQRAVQFTFTSSTPLSSQLSGSSGSLRSTSGYSYNPFASISAPSVTFGQGTNQSATSSQTTPNIQGYSNKDPRPIIDGLYVGQWSASFYDDATGQREQIGGRIEIELYTDPDFYSELGIDMQWLGEMTIEGYMTRDGLDYFKDTVLEVRCNAFYNAGNNNYVVKILGEFGEDQFFLITSTHLDPLQRVIDGNFTLINTYDAGPQAGLINNLHWVR